METASVSRLKAHLSHYLGVIKGGEEVVVTDRGRAIAKIVPVVHGDAQVSPQLAELERAGLAHLGSGDLPDDFWQQTRPADPGGAALRALLDERNDTR